MSGATRAPGLTRRSFLRGAAASALLPIFVRPAWAGRGAGPGGAPLAVVVFLRGGADGLHLVPPVGDDDYARLRGKLALAEGEPPRPQNETDCLFRDMGCGMKCLDRVATKMGLL